MIVLIELIVVSLLVWGIISDVKRVRKVKKSAENCRAKHEIIAILKSLSAAQVSNAACHLSVHSAGYNGVAEIIQVDIKLKSAELAPRYEELKKEYRQAMRASVTATVNGDRTLASQMDGRGKDLQQELKKLFLTRFTSEVDARAIVGSFSDIEDVKVDLASKTIAAYTWIFVGGLYIDAGKYHGFCIPYIFDAIAEAAKSIPNVSLTIDKTIPNQNN